MTEFYAHGYMLAAETLSKSIMRPIGKVNRNFLVYPVLFTWRHYFELRLKEIIVSLCRLQGQEVNAQIWDTHDLKTLWEIRQPLYLSAKFSSGKGVAANDKFIKKFIFLMARIDSKGEAFRYAHDKKKERNPSIRHPFEGFELRSLIKALRKTAFLLEGESEMIAVARQYAAEAETY